LIKYAPRLSDLSLDSENLRGGVTNFDSLSSLPLHTIRVRLDDCYQNYYFPFIPASEDERRMWINLAKEILLKCPQGEVAKKVMVINFDKSLEVQWV